MSLITLQDPTEEPVSLERVKEHCGVDAPDHDALLRDYIAAARREVEAFTRRRLVTQVVEYRVSTLAAEVRLPLAPVQSVDAIDYLAQDGSAQSLAVGNWRLTGGASAPCVMPPVLSAWPVALQAPESVTIRMTVGYGGAADIPADLRVAVLLLAAYYYGNRGDDAQAPEMPPHAQSILQRHVFWV